jgi:DNA invertase Pin-like site-specific DNA recombinase
MFKARTWSKRVACYARVSTVDQSTGLESQIRVLKQYCEQNQIHDVEFFTDEGISGTKAKDEELLHEPSVHFPELSKPA